MNHLVVVELAEPKDSATANLLVEKIAKAFPDVTVLDFPTSGVVHPRDIELFSDEEEALLETNDSLHIKPIRYSIS